MRILPILLISFAASAAFAADATNAVLRTVADVRALSEREFAEERPVALEGQVVAELFGTGRILQDATGRFFFEASTANLVPRLGDVIRMTGDTFLDAPIRQEFIHAYDITVLGNRPPPEPLPIDAQRISSPENHFRTVRISGFISEAFKDEIDPKWNYVVLRSDDTPVYVAVPNRGGSDRPLTELIDADVELTGVVLPHYCAERFFVGPHLELWSKDCIRVIRPPLADPFDSPYLEDIIHVSPIELTKIRRRRVEGIVLAAWRGNRILVREDGGRLIGVELTESGPLPQSGERIQAVGFPETDLFHLNLTRAIRRTLPGGRTAPEPAQATAAAAILLDEAGNRRLRPDCHGRALRLRGIVRSLPSAGNADGRMNLECDGFLVPVDLSANPSAADGLVLGCEVEAAGTCIMEADNWRPNLLFPVLGGFTLVIRTPDDIRVLSRPPWWTPGRLLVVIGSLLAALLGILVWNRVLNRIVERRGRELLKSEIGKVSAELRVDERTRLAVDLHDSIAQELTSASLQLATAASARAVDSAAADRHVEAAMRMLKSCQTDLRHCIWDLRTEALDEKDFGEAIRRMLKTVAGNAAVAIRFSVLRQKVNDTTAHAMLNIIRELVSNAVRHGKATGVRIAGELKDGCLRFSVRDNGCGFDPASAPGLSEGHFGLNGIRERVKHLGGAIEITSAPGAGARAVIAIRVPHPDESREVST